MFLIEIFNLCFTSPEKNCIFKLTEEGETLKTGTKVQMAGVGQNPWGPEILFCSYKTIPCPAEAFLYSAMGHDSTLHVLHMALIFYAPEFPWWYGACLCPYQTKDRDCMFCSHYRSLFIRGLLCCGCWMWKMALCPDSGCGLRHVLLCGEEENGAHTWALRQALTGCVIET